MFHTSNNHVKYVSLQKHIKLHNCFQPETLPFNMYLPKKDNLKSGTLKTSQQSVCVYVCVCVCVWFFFTRWLPFREKPFGNFTVYHLCLSKWWLMILKSESGYEYIYIYIYESMEIKLVMSVVKSYF